MRRLPLAPLTLYPSFFALWAAHLCIDTQALVTGFTRMKHHLQNVFTQAMLWLCLLCAAAWVPLAQADNTAEWRRIAQDIKDKALFEGTPQDMYLRAGNFSRNGDSDKARKIYQHLVQRHSSSPFAVKASDQLDAMARASAAQQTQSSYSSSSSSNSGARFELFPPRSDQYGTYYSGRCGNGTSFIGNHPRGQHQGCAYVQGGPTYCKSPIESAIREACGE